jgi:hypothetical protein
MKLSRLVIAVVTVGVVSCVGLVALVASRVSIMGTSGGYSIDQVVFSKALHGHRPVELADTFNPIGPIYCTITTTGADGGIVGMRWLRENELVYEAQGKTRVHTIISYIEGTPANPLPIGDYRVEVFILDDVAAVAGFQVMQP